MTLFMKVELKHCTCIKGRHMGVLDSAVHWHALLRLMPRVKWESIY